MGIAHLEQRCQTQTALITAHHRQEARFVVAADEVVLCQREGPGIEVQHAIDLPGKTTRIQPLDLEPAGAADVTQALQVVWEDFDEEYRWIPAAELDAKFATFF